VDGEFFPGEPNGFSLNDFGAYVDVRLTSLVILMKFIGALVGDN
jgi:hypothetical protein